MILDDRHISYLEQVATGTITLWWNPPRTLSRYVSTGWGEDHEEVDQTVAAQMHALGATRVTSGSAGKQCITLTDRGEAILLDEAEAWA